MQERSAGAVVFKESNGRSYLLLMNREKWDFPKGNMEEGETELQTVLREVGEETGLKQVSIVPGFRRVIEYFYRREGKNVRKRVTYLLARTDEGEVTISAEHQGFGWFTYAEAMERASYDNSKATLREAEKFMREGEPSDKPVRSPLAGASRRA
jgi:8-oxo-dGTP pyrophosphatase MutT (NUDIX family)